MAVSLIAITMVNAQNFDPFFDNMVKAMVKKNKDFLEPFNVTEIRDSPGFGPVSTQFDEILVTGLSSIRRRGSTNIINDENQRIMTVTMAVGPLSYHATGRVKFLGIGSKKWFIGTVDSIVFTVRIRTDKHSKVTSLMSFKVDELEGIQFEAYGKNGLDNGLKERLIRRSLKTFKSRITKQIEKRVSNMINEQIQTNPLFKMLAG